MFAAITAQAQPLKIAYIGALIQPLNSQQYFTGLAQTSSQRSPH
jgi:hypothetical protein